MASGGLYYMALLESKTDHISVKGVTLIVKDDVCCLCVTLIVKDDVYCLGV